ncbi:ATP-binding protein [Actinomadura scrupuli]|uniref:ATP-binding protein n=1 Tax=Actinomadura scrupuli TaxID=559629 RepID=UPI003D982D82
MTDQERRNGVRLGMARLPLLGTSPKAARDLVETVGRSWGLSSETVYAARLAVSELVTNALVHAAGMPGSTVTVIVARSDGMLAVEVHDASREEPRLRYPPETAESGRGLILVSEVTDACGHYLTPFGKAVWFTLKSDWPLDMTR